MTPDRSVVSHQVSFSTSALRKHAQPGASFLSLGSLGISCGIGEESWLVPFCWSLGFEMAQRFCVAQKGLYLLEGNHADTKNTTLFSHAGNTQSRGLTDALLGCPPGS